MNELEFRNQSCKARVKKHYKSRMKDIKTLYYAEDQQTEDLGNLSEYGLSIDYVTSHTFKDQRQGYFRYQLSWGGPQEEYRFYPNSEKLEFWLLDWFDGAKITITNKENFAIIKDILESFFAKSLKDEASEQEQEALEENY